MVRGGRRRDDSSLRVDRRVRFSRESLLALLVDVSPREAFELSRGVESVAGQDDEFSGVVGDVSLVAVVFELKASTSMLGDDRTVGRDGVGSLADGLGLAVPLVTGPARRRGSMGVSVVRCGNGSELGAVVSWLLILC